MSMATQIYTILRELTEQCEGLFGDRLHDVRLFGSYARGDNSEESDVDVMIIVDMNDSELRLYLDEICRLAAELDLKHNVVLSPLLQSRREFEAGKSVSGFFKNVEREGVTTCPYESTLKNR